MQREEGMKVCKKVNVTRSTRGGATVNVIKWERGRLFVNLFSTRPCQLPRLQCLSMGGMGFSILANIIPTSHSNITIKTQTILEIQNCKSALWIPIFFSVSLSFPSSVWSPHLRFKFAFGQRCRDHHVLAVNNRGALRLVLSTAHKEYNWRKQILLFHVWERPSGIPTFLSTAQHSVSMTLSTAWKLKKILQW